MSKNEKIITNNESTKMTILRKQINKIMNLTALKNFEKLPNIDTLISLYSSKKSYISPKQKFVINKNKEIKRKLSPNNPKNSNKELNNQKNNVEKKVIKKCNYKKKIAMNKQKLNKNNKENNLLLGSLMDDNEGMFDNNSKLKNYVSNKINQKEKNKSLGNNIFDMGSISHISKNGSSSGKEKIGEEEIKNNNPFEKIVYDFVEEENCKNLFQENKNINNINEINTNENPINAPYKSKALNEILNNENTNRESLKDNEEEFTDEIYKNMISKFADDIMRVSKNEVILVEKFVEEIFKECLSKNYDEKTYEEKYKNEVNFVKKFVEEIFKECLSKNLDEHLIEEKYKNEMALIKKFVEDIFNECRQKNLHEHYEKSENEINLIKKFVEDIFNECKQKNFDENFFDKKYKNEIALIKKFVEDIFNECKQKNLEGDLLNEKYKNEIALVKKFVEDIFKECKTKNLEKNLFNEESQNDIELVKKFAEDIFIESIAKNFVKILFNEIMKEIKERKTQKEKYSYKQINQNNIGNSINNELNNSEENYIEEEINTGNNSAKKSHFKTLDKEKGKNNLLKSQENKNIDSVYKRITTLPNVSKNFRFGFFKKNSIRREYQQRKYKTLNSENFD